MEEIGGRRRENVKELRGFNSQKYRRRLDILSSQMDPLWTPLRIPVDLVMLLIWMSQTDHDFPLYLSPLGIHQWVWEWPMIHYTYIILPNGPLVDPFEDPCGFSYALFSNGPRFPTVFKPFGNPPVSLRMTNAPLYIYHPPRWTPCGPLWGYQWI